MLVDYVYDIAQLIEQQGLAPLSIVSHSLGGTIATMYSGLYPAHVRDLVIIEGVGLYPRPPVSSRGSSIRRWIDSGRNLAARSVRKYPTIEAAYERMHEMNPHLTTEQARHLSMHASNQNEDGTYSWKFDNYTRNSSPYDMPTDDLISLWQAIEARVLIINSKTGYPHRIGQDGTDTYFNHLNMINVDNAGHWTHHDRLDAVVDSVSIFLNEKHG